ncbi:hypothetical protein [Paenibacillus validus]|uniref:hypothetical protein n=1 Tax=Paenibacillus validus TaxID=44253 RepID=UPI003D29CD92
MTTIYIFGAGASAAEKAPTVRNFFKKSYDFFQNEESLKPVWTFLSRYYHRDRSNWNDIIHQIPV